MGGRGVSVDVVVWVSEFSGMQVNRPPGTPNLTPVQLAGWLVPARLSACLPLINYCLPAITPAVSNMSIDLRDGLRLCKLAERLTGECVGTTPAAAEWRAWFICPRRLSLWSAPKLIHSTTPPSNHLPRRMPRHRVPVQASRASSTPHATHPTAAQCAWPTCSWPWTPLPGRGCPWAALRAQRHGAEGWCRLQRQIWWMEIAR